MLRFLSYSGFGAYATLSFRLLLSLASVLFVGLPSLKENRKKHCRAALYCKSQKIPTIQFDDLTLTSFPGAVVIPSLFSHFKITEKQFLALTFEDS